MSNVNMEALLDGKLGDLPDLPDFKPYPVGVHRAAITLEPKMVNDKLAISVNFKYISLVELGNPEDVVPAAGAVANILCQMDNEFGAGMFKKVRAALQPACGLDDTASHREVIEKSKGMEVQIVTALKQAKDDADKYYMTLKDIAVA